MLPHDFQQRCCYLPPSRMGRLIMLSTHTTRQRGYISCLGKGKGKQKLAMLQMDSSLRVPGKASRTLTRLVKIIKSTLVKSYRECRPWIFCIYVFQPIHRAVFSKGRQEKASKVGNRSPGSGGQEVDKGGRSSHLSLAMQYGIRAQTNRKKKAEH